MFKGHTQPVRALAKITEDLFVSAANDGFVLKICNEEVLITISLVLSAYGAYLLVNKSTNWTVTTLSSIV